MKLSVIIPVYTEKLLLMEIITKCLIAPLPLAFKEREIIIVDDGSTDGTTEFLRRQCFGPAVRIYHSNVNHGKGFSLGIGFKISSGDVIIIQDSDLEYDPVANYKAILAPFENSESTLVVYGSRFLNRWWPQGMRLSNLIANYILTLATRLLYNCRITDEATCYKVFRRGVLNNFTINSKGFEFCPEFTAKVVRSGSYRSIEL